MQVFRCLSQVLESSITLWLSQVGGCYLINSCCLLQVLESFEGPHCCYLFENGPAGLFDGLLYLTGIGDPCTFGVSVFAQLCASANIMKDRAGCIGQFPGLCVPGDETRLDDR